MTGFSASCGSVVVGLLVICFSAERSTGEVTPPVQPSDEAASRRAAPEIIRQWQNKRFGMFIHWGPVSLKGTEIGWSRGRQVPSAEYDELYKQFNPAQFDADAWVRIAKDAGMKYLVITSKHHDGFCLWPSKYTDYDIAATPFKRDILRELSDACQEHDIQFCTYHSICDWRHPDYPLGSPGGRSQKQQHDMPRYYQYLKNQTKEIIDNYGPLGVMWFDGEWERPWTSAQGNELYDYLKEIQSTLIINNRVSKGRHGMAGTTNESHLNAGDFDTPEQRVGGFNRQRPWETCMTICRQWAWKPNDTMKSKQQCIQTLLHTVGGDGNLLFNVGPMPDGRIEPRQVERLKEMGDWLAKYGDGVYGTRGGPFKPGKWGAATCQGDKVYLFVMNWPPEGPLVLPAIDAKINATRRLDGGAVAVQWNEEGICVDVPPDQRDGIATVVELTVDGPALDIEPVAVVHRSGALSYGKQASASNVFQKTRQYGPDKALDDDPETRWATDAGMAVAWIEIDLGHPTAVGRIRIDEPAQYRRVQAFELQCRDGVAWKTIHAGTTIGPNWSKTVPPVIAQHFRLNITRASDGPTISEVQLFAPKK